MNNNMYIIDLTHTLSESSPTWEGSCGFHLNTVHDYEVSLSKTSFKAQSMSLNCGMGTHIDAPAHFFKDLPTIDKLPLENLINPGILIDISHRRDANNHLTDQDILNFEYKHGLIPADSCVLINTGWHTYWNTPSQYHNNYNFPYIDLAAAEILLARKVRAVGIDTLSPDRAGSDFPVHQLLLAQNVLIIENLANLDGVPAKDFIVTIASLKIENATESPIRIWATV